MTVGPLPPIPWHDEAIDQESDPVVGRLHPGFGARLEARHRRWPDLAADIIGALRCHRVVLIRNLPLSCRSQLHLAAAMGTIVGVTGAPPGSRRPAVRIERGPGAFTEFWHADQSWSTEPDVVSVLACTRAKGSPDPTQFADTSIGYQALDEAMRREIDGLDAHHHVEASRQIRYGHRPHGRKRRPVERISDRARSMVWARLAPSDAVIRNPETVDPPGARHTIVEHDPHTGQRFVRLGDHAWKTTGDDDRAIRLVDVLNERIVDADNVWTHRWRRGDLVVYDNRMVLHRRVLTDAVGADRELRRVLVRPAS